MNELVTFVAAPANKGVPPDLTLQSIAENVGDHGDLVHVARLVDIARYLQGREHDPPRTIQITGHSKPGFLALGYYWDEQIRDPHGLHQVLDSSPYVYGELWGRVQPETRVVIAGCLAGADVATPMVAGGSTLVFDLHKMWGCDVFAADVMVSSTDFVDGYYVGSAYGCTRDGWCRIQGRTQFEPQPVPNGGATFTDVKVTEVPMFGSGLGIHGDDLLAEYSEELQLASRPLALDEIRLSGRVNGDPARFALLADGQLLEATIGETRRFFRPPRRPSAHFARRTDAPGARLWTRVRDELRKRKVT